MLVAREQYALRHEDFYDIEERWKAVHIKANLFKDLHFLGDQLILLAVEALHLIFAGEQSQAVLICLFIILLFGLGWLVTRQLPQEFS